MAETLSYGDYRLVPVLGSTTEKIRKDIIYMWLANRAFRDPRLVDLEARAREAAYIAQNAQGEVVGVSTVYPAIFQADGQPYFFYRMYIRPMDRVYGMMKLMTSKTWELLQSAPERGQARGVIIITDNRKLMRPGLRRMFQRTDCEYIGTTPDGKDIQRKLFGAP